MLVTLSALIMVTAGCCRQESAPQVGNAQRPEQKTAISDKPATQPDNTKQTKGPMPTKPESATSASPNTASTILVKVDDNIITQGDLDKETAQVKLMMKSRGMAAEQLDLMMTSFKPQIIDGLVARVLLKNEYEKKNITVSDDEIKQEIKQIETNLPEERSIKEMLEKSGLTQAAFENDIKEQLKLQKLLNIPKPTDEQIKTYYKENKEKYFEIPATVRVRHILIATSAADDDEAKEAQKKKAESLRKQLEEGADFEKLAREHSSCPSKENGGDLGTFGRGRMVPAFEEAAFSLKTNEISSVIETRFGYHIIEMLEYNKPKTLEFDEVKEQIAAMIKGKELQEKVGALIETLRDKATITYMHGAAPPDRTMTPPMKPVPVNVPKTKPK